VMRPREAELTKYAANAMLATKISFMNEMAELCDELDVDIERVRIGIGADARIGYSFMYAGCGYGGSCFPKDVKALIHTAKSSGARPGILEAVEGRNERQKRRLFDKVVARFGSDLDGRTFAVWGLAFKPDTDGERLTFCSDPYEALDGAHALLLVTEWKQFRNPDFGLMKQRLAMPIVFDGRNQYDPVHMTALGFECYGIGRGTARPDARAA
jgi:UDPglucose 6-dehydrogenase